MLKEKNKKVIGLLKDKLGGKIMTKYVGLRVKTYSEDKKHKLQKSVSNKALISKL